MPRTLAGNRQLARSFGTQLKFPGTGNVISSGPAFGLTGTIMFWIKGLTPVNTFVCDATNGHRYLVYRATDGGWGFYLDNTLITDNASNSVSNLVDPANVGWTHVAITWDSTANPKQIFYKNGAQFVTRNITFTTSSTPTNFYINSNFSSASNGTHTLDDFIICSAAESPTAISNYFYKGILPASAINRWKFDENTGTSTADAIGSLTGTISASNLWVTDPPLGITARTTVPSQIDLTGLVAWWTMRDSDFGTTTLTNEVAGGMNLTLTSPKWVTGNGNALEYNQTSQSVGSGTIAANDLLDFSSATAMTVIGRVNFTGAGGNGNGRLIGAAFFDHVLKQGSINSLLSVTGTNTRWSQAFTPADNTTWVAITYDSTDHSFRLIIDGTQAAVTTTNQTGVFNTGLTGAFKLGADTNVTSVPKGWIYEVAIFKNRALTAAECNTFAKARRSTITSGTRSVVT